MKIKIDRKVFAQGLAEVAPFAHAKTTVMVLKNAKITTKGEWMKIEANDTQSSMVKYIPMMECDTDGSFLIEIADINKFVQRTKGDTLDIDVEESTVRISHSKGKAEFQSQEAKEFPSFRMPDIETTEITVPTSLLTDAIAKGKGFVSTEALRPQMTAIYVYVKDGEFGYCATDTHKLIHGHQAYDLPDTTDVHWLVMPSVFNAILTVCKTAETAVIQITESNVQYNIGSFRIQTVQAKGAYPAFQRVIPQDWRMECAVDKADLLESLGRVALFCDSSECVRVDVSRMDMTLTVDNLDYGKKSTESIPHNGCDGEIRIGLNVAYFQAALGAFNQGEILLRMTEPSRPVVFAQRDNENVISLTMPMSIQNQ